jgi:uncharacterized protein (UPF0128 family)
MDAKERARLKALNKLRIENFGIYFGKANDAKAALDAKLANLSGREVNDMYTQNWKDSEIAKAKLDYRNKLIELYNKEIEPGLTALESSLEEQYSEVDAEALQPTINILKIAGPDIDGETLRKLFIPFAHDQNALRVLQSTVKALGMKYDGGVDKMIYDIPATFSQLQGDARDTFLSEGSSIFRFGIQLGKVAQFEGVDVPWSDPFPSRKLDTSPTMDLDKVTDALRDAAGLSSEGK